MSAALAVTVGLFVMPHIGSAASAVNVSIDFSKAIAAAPVTNIGFTATTFGVGGGPVPNSPPDIAALRQLGAGSVRIHLAPNAAGQIVSGAQGGATDISGDTWLTTYESIGLEPTVVLNLDKSDALAVVNYLVANHHRITRFILGNEMDSNSKSNVSADAYISEFHDIAAAIRAIVPGAQIGGPAPAYFEAVTPQLISGLINAPPAQKASFIDYHAYGAGDGQSATISSALRYSTQLSSLRTMIGDASVGVEVGEFNINWGNDPQDNTPFQTMWVAAALGSILSQGAVAFEYGDKNDAMGLVDNGRAKASYWGLGMFTGGGQFRPFGTTVVSSTSSDPSVSVFASTGEKNIVVVNSGPSTAVNIALAGFESGSADVWQSTNIVAVHLAAAPVSKGSLRLSIPANSVTTLVLQASSATLPIRLGTATSVNGGG